MAVQAGKAPAGQAPADQSPGGRRTPAGRTGNVAVDLARKVLALREGSIIVVTIVAIIYFAATVSGYLSGSNFKNLLPYFCFLAIMAAGEVFVMTLGEIDLSIGALYLITPFIYWKLTTAGIPLVPSVILALVIAAVLGSVNGFFTAYVGIPSFVVTLAMLFFLDGLALIISHSQQITTPGTSVTSTSTFASVFGGGTYSELIWVVVLVGLLQVVLSFTRWGVYTVATGGNRLAAAEAGIRTRVVIVRNFMLCAMTAGLAGVLEAVRTSSMTPDPSGSNQNLLYAVAAVIIGGTLMTGGEGTVVGALLGALFLGILQDGLNLKSVPANYVYLYLGIAVIIAMVLYVLVRRIRTGSGRG
jgi:simple sugar transport system permease protein